MKRGSVPKTGPVYYGRDYKYSRIIHMGELGYQQRWRGEEFSPLRPGSWVRECRLLAGDIRPSREQPASLVREAAGAQLRVVDVDDVRGAGRLDRALDLDHQAEHHALTAVRQRAHVRDAARQAHA